MLEAKGDTANALFARLVLIRRLVLLGKVRDAGRALAELHLEGAPFRLVAVAELVAADVATRELRPSNARRALDWARVAALASRVPPLIREVEGALAQSRCPRRSTPRRRSRTPRASGRCRRVARSRRSRRRWVPPASSSWRHDRTARYSTRLILPCGDTGQWAELRGDTADLIGQAFATRRPNESHRARLRVEIGRLRKSLSPMASVEATPTVSHCARAVARG